MLTFSVLTVATLTVLNEDGLVEDIVPMSIVGDVITPASDTANPDNVISLQESVGVADCVTVSFVEIVSPELE
jgi:hypothetical protein